MILHIMRMMLELFLGVCLKLFCDNGRISWKDLRNDLFFWLPGVKVEDGDGLNREVDQEELSEEEKKNLHTQKLANNVFMVAMLGFFGFAFAALMITLT